MAVQNTNNNDHRDDIEQGDEISLLDIMAFLTGEWRRLLGAAVVTMILVIGGALLFGGYKANGLIINTNPSAPSAPSNDAFDFVKWKYFQKALPDLASELLHSGRVKPDDEEQFTLMSRPEWWDKNVVPVLALSKNDAKVLGSISKELQDAAGTIIHYLEVSGVGDTKEAAQKNLAININFIRSGSTYLALKGLVLDVDTTTAKADADLRNRVLSAEVEMKFLEQKSKNLDLLRKRFPGNTPGAGALGQVLDPKDAAAKYLPLDTQVVAVNADIYNLHESLTRLKDAQIQSATKKNFLSMAIPAVAQITEGTSLGDELLKIVTQLRKDVRSDDLVRQQAVTDLEAKIRSILTTFDKGLQSSVMPQARRASKLGLLGALGFMGGGMAMLLFVMTRRALESARERRLDMPLENAARA